ncbi:MAG TPA: calcium/proton exchanger [Reyranella sp.]|nr:calcium/proton exchanger [Reyranella sp.]
MMSWLLIFIPVAIGLEHWLPHQHIAIFAASGLAILPLAGWMGRATEHLAERLGEGVGGLLNATFGNAAELIIALVALQAGLHDVVKASIAGSIIGNILLVQGAAMLAGGLRHKEQKFGAEGARAEAGMLTLAAIALILPAAYKVAMGGGVAAGLVPLSLAISGVLLGVYGLFLLYSLRTHAGLFRGSHAAAAGAGADEGGEGGHEPWPVAKAGGVLAAATVGIAWMSELLVGSIQPAAAALGLGSAFAGVFVVAILGNAAEHATAITVALKNRMDLALSIAIGSSIQVALFVAPVLVLASLAVGPRPMDLVLPGGLVLSVLLAVLISGQTVADGRSDWLKGAQLLAVYGVLGLTYFFIPGAAP